MASPPFDGLTVRVLHDGQLVQGTLVAFDRTMSPVLRDCVEIHPTAGRHVSGPLVFPRTMIASLAIEPPLSPSPPSNHASAPPLALSAHPAAFPLSPSPVDWVVDFGASFHTTPTTSSLFHSHPPHPSHPSSIFVGNGSTLPVTSVGASVLPGPFCLNDVFLAPGLTHPLLSVRRFTSDNQCSMEFDPLGLTIRHLPIHAVLARCDSSSPLFSLHLPSTLHTRVASSPALTTTTTSHALATTTTFSAIWHRRLGHPGPDVMSQLSGHSDISYTRGSSERLCHACQLGRHSRLPFSTSTSRAVQAFDLVRCDVWTSPVLSLFGYKYYLVILDDYSHLLWTFPLRLKSDTFTTLTSSPGYPPSSGARSVHCSATTAASSTTTPLGHSSSPVAFSCVSRAPTPPPRTAGQRMIRTTTNMIRCLLFQANLPASYWAEALHTATHLLNRLPSKAVSHPTPYFALYGTAPTYDHLRVFGCACYPNTSATAPHKLSPRSTRCLFLGYSFDHKGYRCLDLASHRIIISRHVVFDEDVFPLAGPPHPPTSTPSSSPIRLPLLPGAPPCAVTRTPCGLDAAARAYSRATRGPVDHACATRGLVDHACASRGPPTPLAPCAALLTPTTRFADPALVYYRRRHVTTSAPADPGPSTSPVRFADPAVYHRRESATPAAPDVPADRPEPPVYHPVAIHRDPGHVHPMVTRRAAGVLQPVDRLILAADTTTTPPDASPVPSSVRTALADPHW
jgi:hypothetical protein